LCTNHPCGSAKSETSHPCPKICYLGESSIQDTSCPCEFGAIAPSDGNKGQSTLGKAASTTHAEEEVEEEASGELHLL
jgi:hypothetical protein